MPNHVHGIVILKYQTNVGAGLKPAPVKIGARQMGLKPAFVEIHEQGADLKPAFGPISQEWAGFKPAPTGGKRHGLPEIMRAFKVFSSRRINEFRETKGVPAWQRNYYEHVIRNEKTLNAIREYIEANPSRWQEDPEHPDAVAI